MAFLKTYEGQDSHLMKQFKKRRRIVRLKKGGIGPLPPVTLPLDTKQTEKVQRLKLGFFSQTSQSLKERQLKLRHRIEVTG